MIALFITNKNVRYMIEIRVKHAFSVHTQKRATCNKSVDILQQLVTTADIRMRSYGLRQLIVDDKSVASCQQTCCKLIVKTCYPHGLLEVVSTKLTSILTGYLVTFCIGRTKNAALNQTHENLVPVFPALRKICSLFF